MASLPHLCTQMPIPPELQADADMKSIQENPLNGHQITTGAPVQGGGPPTSLALPIGSLWKNGRTLRVKILNGSDKIKGKIRQYGSLWTQFANLRMEFVDSGNADIRVNVDASGGSWSYVGTGNLVIAQNQPTMNFGWLTDNTAEDEFSRVIIHEFGHALGCIHEHQSPAANIPWNREAVYNYYQVTQGWSRAQVDVNIFQLYDRSTTQFSAWDAGSIMLYAIPASLTTNGFSTGWNRQLSETDKAFIAKTYPPEGMDIASFNTMEIRPWDQPTKEAMKRQTYPAPYNTPPKFAVGLNWLDIDHATNIRVKAYADNITKTAADMHIDTWADTTLYSAGCTWMRIAADDPDFQTGQFSTQDDHPWQNPQMKTSRAIKFDRPFAAGGAAAPPKVVIWLNVLDMQAGKNWRINATATDVTATGFTIHLDTWADTVLYVASAAWIAYPAGKPGVTSGTYNTQDVRPWDKPQLANSGRVNFPAGVFQGTPKAVLLAFNSMDIDQGKNLRLRLSADSVSKDGFNWHADSWYDTILYSAGASYIAFA
ncbi:hypothetical protein QBC46DRAFT_375581 [Diplogelasinospora grovesii]|uniref:Peptidase metallopeptidase domain-containing protein n=1 Tax=Diplogelasinospora grovesii TaxID=303347 RepID=A0AAN6S7Q2_9PEZI|nr:hypothetical protein QBC46DRAFT_375581 [Diplogelasinospora grovesii]